MFFLWASAVMLAAQAFEINTSLNNAVQYISQIFVTSDGTPTGTTGIFLDGTNGGKIGIWTNTPSQALEVNGNVALTTGWRIWAATNQIYMARNGNVGIGLPNPTEKLEVGGNAWIGSHANYGYSSTWGTFLRLAWLQGNITDSSQPNIQLDFHPTYPSAINYNRKIDGGTTFGVSFATWTYNYKNIFTISSWGNVGIGTATPSQVLEVNGNISLTAGWRMWAATNQVYTAQNGNVGIGTWTPSEKLDVLGWVRVANTSLSGYGATFIGYLVHAGNPTVDWWPVSDNCPADRFIMTGNCSIVSDDGEGWFYRIDYTTTSTSVYACKKPGTIIYANGSFWGCKFYAGTTNYRTPLNNGAY